MRMRNVSAAAAGEFFSRLRSSLPLPFPVAGLFLIAFVLCAFTPTNATADLNQNLCQYNPVRGAVPAHYALDACVDGAFIVIRNDGDFPVQLIARRTPDSHTNSPLRFLTKATASYASETRRVHDLSNWPGTMILPGDRVRYEDGDNGATIKASINVKDYDGYVLAKIMSNFIPIVGQVDAFKDLDAAMQESWDQYGVCKSRSGLHACGPRREAQQVAAILAFLGDVAPGRAGLAKLAKKIWNVMPAWVERHDPETALDDYDTVLTQGPVVVEPCIAGAQLRIVLRYVSDTPSLNVATVGQKYYANFESHLSTPNAGDQLFGVDWSVSGVPGFHIGWTAEQGIERGTHGSSAEIVGPATAPGSYTVDLSTTYRSPLTGQLCAVAEYLFPIVVTEPPPPPP